MARGEALTDQVSSGLFIHVLIEKFYFTCQVTANHLLVNLPSVWPPQYKPHLGLAVGFSINNRTKGDTFNAANVTQTS